MGRDQQPGSDDDQGGDRECDAQRFAAQERCGSPFEPAHPGLLLVRERTPNFMVLHIEAAPVLEVAGDGIGEPRLGNVTGNRHDVRMFDGDGIHFS